MTLAEVDNKYYDSERLTEDEALDKARWWVCYMGEDGEMIDVLAKDKRDVYPVMIAALTRDYDPSLMDEVKARKYKVTLA